MTFEEKGGTTQLVFRDLYPSQAAFAAATAGMEGGLQEQFVQLDELLGTLADKP